MSDSTIIHLRRAQYDTNEEETNHKGDQRIRLHHTNQRVPTPGGGVDGGSERKPFSVLPSPTPELVLGLGRLDLLARLAHPRWNDGAATGVRCT